MNYGLIGNPLKHSFSKEIHSRLANYSYELCELDDNSFDAFMQKKDFKGINVTIPYKKRVIPYLDYINEDAKEIDAVNTIINDGGKLRGYNTDILGVLAAFNKFKLDIDNKTVLILGTGATSNTIGYAVKKSGAKRIYKSYRVSSKTKGDILYEDLNKIYDEINIIINATSNGTYPHADDPLLTDLSKYKNLEAVIDVVYNPLRTRLLIEAERLHIKAVSGLYMLVAQAYFASELFTNAEANTASPHTVGASYASLLSIDNDTCESAYKSCLQEKQNIVLIGMPTCGKSTIGKKLANRLNLTFIDTDTEIEKEINMKISDYITKNGEESFRDIESKVIKNLSTVNKAVISTGGGSILKEENIINLKHNGKIYFMNRSIALLHPTTDRPLTSDYQSLKKKYDERLPIYKAACDKEINGDLEIKDRVELIINDFS